MLHTLENMKSMVKERFCKINVPVVQELLYIFNTVSCILVGFLWLSSALVGRSPLNLFKLVIIIVWIFEMPTTGLNFVL